MISEDAIEYISKLFCGEISGDYSPKKGQQLVSFFNDCFGYKDIYGPGFPTKWLYVYNKIIDLIAQERFDEFLNTILEKAFIARDLRITEVEAAEKSNEILTDFNRVLAPDRNVIIKNDSGFHLINKDADMVLIGSGAFANVYRQKSTGLVIKKLKDEYLSNSGFRSRFKREFTITKSLQGIRGIISVYAFDEGACSYTMEPADQTLEDYVLKDDLSDEIKLNCIRQILYIMTQVHNRDIIHRDLSPNNIFIISGQIKIADFGLGKDLNVLSSHQTLNTNSVGQYLYCAPEQFIMLRDADKRSDVFSLGKIINFIMTGNPNLSNHTYRYVTEKATNSDEANRYADAGQLSTFFEKTIDYHNQEKHTEIIQNKIQRRECDYEVENYILEMNSETICKMLLSGKPGFSDVLIVFMKTSDERAQHIIQSIESSFRDVCGRSFEANDAFAIFSNRIIKDNFSFVVKEVAAHILRHVAWSVNRFSAQRMVESLIDNGIEPLIEDILKQ